ncbi:MAG TPA: amidohydrolase family protein [Acidimicrobiales bacterium]|nr:amidohydrolase family protein [Acidimicrobiales bacterium]
MAVNGWLVADSDMHVMEPADLWQRYMDPAWEHAAPVGMTEIERDMRVKVKNAVVLRLGRMRPRAAGRPWKDEQDPVYVHAEERNWDAKSQMVAMEMEHLDATVLFPSRGLFVLSLQSAEHIGPDGLEPELATAIAAAYNDWMADFVAECEAPGRVFGAAMLAPHDVSGAVDELARNVERGFRAAFLVPGLVDNRPWHHPHYDPLWREAERLGVPVCFHGGGATYLKPDFAFSEHLDKLMLWHPFNQPLGVMFVTTCFTSGGILERFPELRVGLLEGNCSWAPFMMYRLDEHYEWTGRFEAPELTMKPSEYLLRNCFLSVEADEEPAKHYFEDFGDDNVVYSTDYPHADSKFPGATEAFCTLPFAEATKRKVLWDNFAKLYDIPAPEPAPAGAEAPRTEGS